MQARARVSAVSLALSATRQTGVTVVKGVIMPHYKTVKVPKDRQSNNDLS